MERTKIPIILDMVFKPLCPRNLRMKGAEEKTR
jgi:hypothetical protein